LEKYDSNWKELIERARDIDVFKENIEFMNFTDAIFEKEKT
jgi:hypothetical protein